MSKPLQTSENLIQKSFGMGGKTAADIHASSRKGELTTAETRMLNRIDKQFAAEFQKTYSTRQKNIAEVCAWHRLEERAAANMGTSR